MACVRSWATRVYPSFSSSFFGLLSDFLKAPVFHVEHFRTGSKMSKCSTWNTVHILPVYSSLQATLSGFFRLNMRRNPQADVLFEAGKKQDLACPSQIGKTSCLCRDPATCCRLPGPVLVTVGHHLFATSGGGGIPVEGLERLRSGLRDGRLVTGIWRPRGAPGRIFRRRER